MRQFEELFTDEKIIGYICKVRAKLAKQRNKKHAFHILTSNDTFNYHLPQRERSKYEEDLMELLNSILPPRKKWKKLGVRSRYKKIEGSRLQKLSTVDKNTYSLLKTINYYRTKKPSEPFVVRLNGFIQEVQHSVKSKDYSIRQPIIYPKAKDKKKDHELKVGENNICRPLSLFNLKDRLILSITNNYFTRLFDRYFDDCSLAFRIIPNQIVNHHTAIQKITEYKKMYPNIALWVAECDMKKFYDSVDHKIIGKQFDYFLHLAQQDWKHLNFDNCKRLFYSYLSCYCFNLDVLPKNSDPDYWRVFNIPRGKFGWIDEEIHKFGFYQNIKEERIGVPQGGALSGLIANLVLDITDKAILSQKENLFYIRFCDDMIIMHPEKEKCETSIELYRNTLKDIKLLPHDFSQCLIEDRVNSKKKKYLPNKSLRPFWEGKSKGPYKWDSFEKGGFSWIGFVGYELHFDGAIRVRKNSLEKELKKQKDVLEKTMMAVEIKQRVSGKTVSESLMRKLIGMSVGRVELWNYRTVHPEMCWKNGFQELNKNRHSIKQIKRLDRARSKVYYDVIKKCSDPIELAQSKRVNSSDRSQIISYDKPFSYYYHVIERMKNRDKSSL